MQINGQCALVTGSSRGVGRATAIELAKRGCSVAVNYNSSKEKALEAAAEIEALGVQAVAIQADVSNDADCRRLARTAAERLGRLSILVNNAGATRFIAHDDLEAVTDEDWTNVIGANLKGVFQCVRAARPYLDKEPMAAIVNVASIAGIEARGSSIPYAASKAGVINMTQSLARALAPRIRVNAVAPGFIDGDWLRQGLGEGFESAKAAREAKSALGKVCRPEDIAQAIISLISGSDLVTGQTMVVDGGSLIGPKGSL